MVRVAVLFVLIAVGLNVAGQVMDDGLALIYASIASSTVAALLLVVGAQRAKRQPPPGPPAR